MLLIYQEHPPWKRKRNKEKWCFDENEEINKTIGIIRKQDSILYTSSNTFAYNDKAIGALYMPAQPQEHSFLRLSCGALSVPRKNFLLPLVTADTIACPGWEKANGTNKTKKYSNLSQISCRKISLPTNTHVHTLRYINFCGICASLCTLQLFSRDNDLILLHLVAKKRRRILNY